MTAATTTYSATKEEPAIEAELNYLRDTGTRPVNYTYDPPPGVPRTTAVADPRRVRIRNARLRTDLGLDTSGFQLLAHRSALQDPRDYEDDDRVRSLYYPEVIAGLREATGAEKVIVFDHTVRDSTPNHGRTGIREVAARVHDDQTFASAPNRVRRHLSPEEAEQRLQRRFAIVNFWRPIGEPVQSWPLALCDARSIATSDLVVTDHKYRDWTGETYSFLYSERHRWFYYPRQRRDEVLLLKIYDSQTDGTARLTAHTAFEDPTTPPDAPPRRSIEVRTLLFF